MNNTSLRIDLVNRSGLAKTLLVLIAWSMMATQCSKQIAPTDETDTDRQSLLQRSQKTATLTVNAYPGGPQRPVHWPVAGSEFYMGTTAIDNGWLDIQNDNSSLFLVVNNLAWKATPQNLNIWIGLANSALPLAPNAMPNVSRFPVQLSVPAGTEQYCVEIEFAALSQYLGVAIDCDTDFSMIIQADVMHNGKACKVWAGDNKNSRTSANSIFYWFNGINAYCGSGMPNP
jgi:hypothetical protein